MDTQAFTWTYFWQAGGFGMYQVAAFGITVLLAAARFALRPDERRIPFVRAMTIATLLAMALGVTTDIGEACRSIPQHAQNPADWHRLMLIGLFESSTPAQLGFALLSLAWLAQAIGLRRLAHAMP
ncbi:MAG: hypothetical protein ABW321_18195 [Polyangiales bacterium]